MSLSSESCIDLDSKEALHAITNSNGSNSRAHILPTFDDDLVPKVVTTILLNIIKIWWTA